jgi:hypothetical protein
MPLRKHEPIPEEAMNYMSPKDSICEVLRRIYWKTDDPEIKLNCRIATSMAKAMTKKLTGYRKKWEEDFWDENPEYKPTLKRTIALLNGSK